MADEGCENSEEKIQIEHMPLVVKHLVDSMTGIDPNFSLEDWLIEKANQDIEILSSDIEREKIQLEQRIHRLEAIAKRVELEDIREVPLGQTNLFDCFDLSGPLKHLSKRIEEITDEEVHPVGTFLNLMPNEECDDPLLAITAQLILIAAQEKIGQGSSWADLEDLFAPLLERGVIPEECDEALDHLLMTGQIHEIDDDCFILDD